MNLKSLIAVAAIAATGSALAAYESPVKLCQIKLETASTNAIIALPLVNVGSTTANPTNYVLKTGLVANDFLYASYGEKKLGWKIDSNGEWEPVRVTVDGVTYEPGTSLDRGTGVWLKRQSKTAPVYLYGQIATNAVTSTATGKGFTMMGNPKTSNVTLQSLTWDPAPSEGDEIEILTDENAFGAVTYTWMKPSAEASACWCSETLNTETWDIDVTVAPSIVLKPGEGFWYRNTNSSNNPTINWGAGE